MGVGNIRVKMYAKINIPDFIFVYGKLCYVSAIRVFIMQTVLPLILFEL